MIKCLVVWGNRRTFAPVNKGRNGGIGRHEGLKIP